MHIPKAPVPLMFKIIYEGDRWAIANNLKPIGTAIVSVEKKSVSSTYYFEVFAYFSETALIVSH